MRKAMIKHGHRWKGGPPTEECVICGVKFITSKNRIKKGGGKLCSVKCYGIWQSKNRAGKNSPTWKGGKIEKICRICHKIFYVHKHKIEIGWGKFCSMKCMGINQSMLTKGENNPNWKGGINPINHQIRNSDKYKKWRLDVFMRDNFTCQECGDKTGDNLNAHHKKRFSVILKDLHQKFPLLSMVDIAENYDNLWNIENGITLCKTCHQKINRRSI